MTIYYVACAGPCVGCGRDEVCCDHRGRALCQTCWHGARSNETPYNVYRDCDGHLSCDGAYTKEEAEDWARELTERNEAQFAGFIRYRDEAKNENTRAHYAALVDHLKNIPRTHTAKPCDRWWGERMAHPGYMASRRATILAR
jgi:hypothetical protein